MTARSSCSCREAVDDYVGPDNPVRFIEAFVDGLDLAAAGFVRVAPKPTGRPGCAPADLLKLTIYGYLNRVRSSRRLEAEARRNIEVILARPASEARLQDDRRLPAREPGRLPRGVPRVRAALPRARPVRPRAARGGRHADQGGEQQGPQLHARRAGDVHPRCGREAGRVHEAARRGTTPKRSRPAMVRPRTAAAASSPRRSRRLGPGANGTEPCWTSWIAPARIRSR